MPLTRELEMKAKDDITSALHKLIDRYLREGVDLIEMKRYFKTNKMFSHLLDDINHVGRRFFKEEEGLEYKQFVKSILNELLIDRIALEETNKLSKRKVSERKVSSFEGFMLNESIDLDSIDIKYLFNDLGYSDDDMDILSSYFKTKVEYIESKNPKYCVYSIMDFNSDILKNNRTRMDVMILADFQLEKMKENINKKILNGVYSNVPEEVDFMGIKLKPTTFFDKSKLKDVVKTLISEKEIVNLISKLTKFTFDKKYGEYYIWKKAN